MALQQIPAPASGTVQLRHTLTSSGTFSLGSVSSPQNIWVVCVGGGAGGGAGLVHDYSTAVWGGCGAGGPGGAAGGVTINPYIMTGTVSYTIGAGGTGAVATTANPTSGTTLTGGTGGTTNFGELLAHGGWAGNVVNRQYPPAITMYFNDAQTLGSSATPINAISSYYNSSIGTRALASATLVTSSEGALTGHAFQQTFGTSAGGYGGGAGQNFTSGHTAGKGGNGGNGGTGGAVGTASGAGTGWQGQNGAGGTIPIYYTTANPIYSGFAGGGGGGGAGGSANGVAATAGTGGAASTYGGTGGNGGAGGTTSGSGNANGSAGSNATGYGAGGGGGGGTANGNTRQGNAGTNSGGAGGNGSQGAIYILY
jgi:hypothetical protein